MWRKKDRINQTAWNRKGKSTSHAERVAIALIAVRVKGHDMEGLDLVEEVCLETLRRVEGV